MILPAIQGPDGEHANLGVSLPAPPPNVEFMLSGEARSVLSVWGDVDPAQQGLPPTVDADQGDGEGPAGETPTGKVDHGEDATRFSPCCWPRVPPPPALQPCCHNQTATLRFPLR